MEYKIWFNRFLTTELSINNTFFFEKMCWWSRSVDSDRLAIIIKHTSFIWTHLVLHAANQNTVVWNAFQNQTMAWWSLWNEGNLCQLHQFDYTPLKFNMEPKVMEVWKMIFLFSWVILRFQPLNFRGVPYTLLKPPRNILTTGQRFIPKLVSTVILSKSTAARNDQ